MLKSASSLLDLARTHEHGDLQEPRRSISCVQQRPQEDQSGDLHTVGAHGQSSFCDQERPEEGQTGYLQTVGANGKSSSISLSAETADKKQKPTDVQPKWNICGKLLCQSAHDLSIALSIQDSAHTGHGDAGLHELEVPEEGIATAAFALYYYWKVRASNVRLTYQFDHPNNLKELYDDIGAKTGQRNYEVATVEYPEHGSVAEVIKKMESLSGTCDMTKTLKKPNGQSKKEITKYATKSKQLDYESHVAKVIKELESLSDVSVKKTQDQRKMEIADHNHKKNHKGKIVIKLEQFAPDSIVGNVIKTIESPSNMSDVVNADKKTQDQRKMKITKTDTKTEHKNKKNGEVDQPASKPNVAIVVQKSEPNSDKSDMNNVTKKTQDKDKRGIANTDTKTEHKNKTFAKVEQNNKEIADYSASSTQAEKTKETGKKQKGMPQTSQSDEQPLARLEDMYVYKAKKKQLTKQDLSMWKNAKPAAESVKDNQKSNRKAYPLHRLNFNKNSVALNFKDKMASKFGKKSKECLAKLDGHKEKKSLHEAVNDRENTHSTEANGQTDTAIATEGPLRQEPNANGIDDNMPQEPNANGIDNDIEKVTGTENIEQSSGEIKKKTKLHLTSCFRNIFNKKK